jgi:hypothetical protein
MFNIEQRTYFRTILNSYVIKVQFNFNQILKFCAAGCLKDH